MIFETGAIYAVDPEDNSLRRQNEIVRPIGWQMRDGELNLPLNVANVDRHDLAVFGHSIDETGVRDDGFLVVMSNPGLLATEEFLLGNPTYQTGELARKFATLTKSEAAQLGVNGLIHALSKRFPRIRGMQR